MAHQTTHRRNLAAPHPEPPPPMESAPKRHPKPSPLTFTATGAAAKRHPIYPLPDPSPPTTIKAISHHFSKLCTHHKKLLPNSLKLTHPNPNQNLILDSSCATTALTKSNSQRERNSTTTLNSGLVKTKVKEKDDSLKKPSFNPKRSLLEEFDVKKSSSQLMSKSVEEGEGMEIRGRVSLSSSSIPPSVNGGGGGGGRRRSFCSSQVELADFLSSSGVKIVAVDMPPFMQIHAVDCARKAHDSLEKFTSKTLAFTLKKEFDGVYGPAWHCIVGTSFGSFVTHSVGGFIYFSMDHKLYVLLFKTTVQRAE